MPLPQSAGSPVHMKEGGVNGEAVNISAEKILTPDSAAITSPQQQCSTSNTGGGGPPLVYVRRKAEAELGRSTGCHNLSDHPQVTREHGEQNTTNQQTLAEPKDLVSTCMDSSPGSQTTKPCVSSPFPNSSSNYSAPPSNNTSCHPIAPTNSLLADHKSAVDVKHWHELYSRLQNLLEELDQSNQEYYIQMLRSRSSVELSRHAVELEKRCIQLSLEEGKELQRVRVLDVLGRYSDKS